MGSATAQSPAWTGRGQPGQRSRPVGPQLPVGTRAGAVPDSAVSTRGAHCGHRGQGPGTARARTVGVPGRLSSLGENTWVAVRDETTAIPRVSDSPLSLQRPHLASGQRQGCPPSQQVGRGPSRGAMPPPCLHLSGVLGPFHLQMRNQAWPRSMRGRLGEEHVAPGPGTRGPCGGAGLPLPWGAQQPPIRRGPHSGPEAEQVRPAQTAGLSRDACGVKSAAQPRPLAAPWAIFGSWSPSVPLCPLSSWKSGQQHGQYPSCHTSVLPPEPLQGTVCPGWEGWAAGREEAGLVLGPWQGRGWHGCLGPHPWPTAAWSPLSPTVRDALGQGLRASGI